MSKVAKIAVVIVLIVIVSAVIAVKQQGKIAATEPAAVASSKLETTTDSTAQSLENPSSVETTANLPRLVDLGADKCMPCKLMAPILEELKQQYAGRLQVEFMDVWKNPAAAAEYGIQIIPTQIFYDAGGKELFRHVGFFSKADILAKWNELGVNLVKGANNEKN